MRSIRSLSIIILGVTVSAPRFYSEEHLSMGVSATTRIVGQRYCAVDEEVATLGLTLNTTLVNNGSAHLELTENFYPKLLVARTLRDLRMGRYELEQHAPEKLVVDPADKISLHKRVRALPGDSVKSTTEVFVLVALAANNVPKDALPPGRHYLQANVHFAIVEGAQARYRSVVSPPVAFIVKANPETSKCLNNDLPDGS